MNLRKEIFKRGSIGALIGIALAYLALIIYTLGNPTITLNTASLIKHVGIYTVISIYGSVVSIVFNLDEWSLLKQSSMHFIAIFMFIPAGIYLNWIPNTPIYILGSITLLVVFYLIQWFISYNYWKKSVTSINHALKEK
jgi:hypothetical protein